MKYQIVSLTSVSRISRTKITNYIVTEITSKNMINNIHYRVCYNEAGWTHNHRFIEESENRYAFSDIVALFIFNQIFHHSLFYYLLLKFPTYQVTC